MLKLAFRGLWARKLRTALTGFAVVLGVAFVAGTFIFTDTIDASFKDLFERTQKGVDVSVQARLAVEEDFAVPPTMPADVLERVQSVDGVEEASGYVTSDGTILDRDGEPILSQGPPTLITSVAPERFDPLTYVEGGPPESADEVVLDKSTAEEYGFRVGEPVTISGRAPAKRYTVSGISTVGDMDSLAGARLVLLTVPETQRVTGHDGYDEISVAADGGTTPEALKAAIGAELGRDYAVRTGKEQAEKQAQDLSNALGFIRTALLVFAGVALLVGSFLIFNTFSVTVAQRAKEFALLRTLGASQRQILRSVIAETLVIGLLASVAGIAAGMLLAPALAAMLAGFGVDLGTTGMQLEPRTILAGLAVGMIATVVSGFVPARRATRVQPVEAMRESVTPGPVRMSRRRAAVAALVEAAGVGLLFYGLFGDPGTANTTAVTLGCGSVLMIFGFALFAPALVRPLSSLIGRPLERMQGVTGRLARENATRQPQRTAVTASALMIGVALVVLVATFAAGLRATIDQGIDEQVKAAAIVTHEDGFSPLPDGVTERLTQLDGVSAVSRIRFERGNVVGATRGTATLTGIDPATVRDVLTLEWQQGSDATLAELGERQVVVNPDFADRYDVGAGDTVTFGTPRGREVDYEVVGVYDPAAGVLGGVLVSNASLERDWESKDLAFALVAGAPGADPEAVQRGADAALAQFPTAKPQTIEAFKDEQNEQVNGLLGLVYALLSLSVLVALLGIVNTLALSVHERTRELGMLRAVGMSRRQARRMVRAESVITAAIGATLGIVLGLVFAAILSRPLADEGFVLELPVGTLIAVTILAALAGVLAAIPPARRAARVDVLRAVTTE